MDEKRLAEIEAQTKSLRRRATEQVIHCNDGVERYGDEALEILHAADTNIPDLIAEVRRPQHPKFSPDWFAHALDLIAHGLQGTPSSISHEDRVKYMLAPAGELNQYADEMRALAKEWKADA